MNNMFDDVILKEVPLAMRLSDQEHDWIYAIKKEVEESTKKEIYGRLTDLDYVQHALVAKGDIYLAMKNIRRLKSYREKYAIQDTIEDAMLHIRRLIQIMPDFLVSVGPERRRKQSTNTSCSSCRNVIYINEDGFRSEALTKHTDWATMWVALYYIFQAVQSDVMSIRDGIIFAANCETPKPKHFFSMQGKKHFALTQLYKDIYPINVKEISFLRPCETKKTFYRLCKPFLSKEMRNAVHLTADTTDITERLSKEFLPTKMGGTQTQEKLLDYLELSLIKRYGNTDCFSLVKEIDFEEIDFC